MFDDVLARIGALPEAERKAVIVEATKFTAKQKFIPNPGPQTECWDSLADEVFFGGGAGGGKSSLLCGLAIEVHERSIIFRREYPQIKGLVDECSRILGTRDGYNGHEKTWRLPGGGELEFGSVQHEDDKEKYQGRAHDLKGFDEITHFSETQYRFLIGWNRSAEPGRRCRVIATGNPPLSAEGEWVIRYWGPWLDPAHPRPAKPGELRWYTVINGQDTEVDGPGPHLVNGKPIIARSRTFIPAKLEDNPDLLATGYAAVLEGMREPMRSMMRDGRFDVTKQDAHRQLIPTAWVIAAQNRWTEDGWKAFAMTAMALDPAGGGEDDEVLAIRHGGWYAPLINGPGDRDGSQGAANIVKRRRDSAAIVIDGGGGYGGAVGVRLQENGIGHRLFNGANSSMGKTRDGLKFINKRAETWWRFAEELDPDREGGSAIALPPDAELRADLTAPTFEVGPRGIQVEAKEHLRQRLGRSPGKGDAVVMCLSEGNAAVRRLSRGSSVEHSQPVLGYAHLKRNRGR